jgi:hypothetical protein
MMGKKEKACFRCQHKEICKYREAAHDVYHKFRIFGRDDAKSAFWLETLLIEIAKKCPHFISEAE